MLRIVVMACIIAAVSSANIANPSQLQDRHYPHYNPYEPEIEGSYPYNPIYFPQDGRPEGPRQPPVPGAPQMAPPMAPPEPKPEASSPRPGSTAVASCQCEAVCRAMALRGDLKP